MLSVVIDTNIILSSLLQPLGPPAQVLYLVRLGFLQMCVSAPACAEYEQVLQRPHFQRVAESIPPIGVLSHSYGNAVSYGLGSP